jgi:hypothetical protein
MPAQVDAGLQLRSIELHRGASQGIPVEATVRFFDLSSDLLDGDAVGFF